MKSVKHCKIMKMISLTLTTNKNHFQNRKYFIIDLKNNSFLNLMNCHFRSFFLELKHFKQISLVQKLQKFNVIEEELNYAEEAEKSGLKLRKQDFKSCHKAMDLS